IARTRIAYETVGECASTDVVAKSPGLRKRRTRLAVLHELDSDEETASAHVADLIEFGERVAHGFLECSTRRANPFEQLVALDDALYGKSCRASGRMTGECVTGHERAMFAENGSRHARGNQSRSQRNVAARQSLGDAHDIGHHAVMLQGPPRAAAAGAAHHFVGNQQYIVFAAHGPDGSR